ncbi:hypothetical protein B0H11DRAFT_1927932 [Mycena galericulata]|nr:hypothetical protein B0H11DRAFT_1927932 [Mycena galericulata]
MFRPARFWPRARKSELPRVRKTFFGDPPTKINLMSKGSVDISKCFTPSKEQNLPYHLKIEQVIEASQVLEAQVAGLKSSQSTLNLTEARLESGLGRTCKPMLGSDLVMSLIQNNTKGMRGRRKYEYEIKIRAIKVP